ncbi:SPOR domain-containing protein [Aurantiacibacter spongiae]|uniref:SPOR domain-containing protein n=1 Tax=Aurantiacibacter spongiae TaxID=2488860 RepID=A0A3N5DRZ7_9SPHN|nr:SPOR domain-containing protein [Aurantiacibacter spongiae]RPF71951.1 SPOR domain-containing protein [Aurantiacibacter spongiae]
MSGSHTVNPMLRLGLGTAMAAAMLSGCAGHPAPRADVAAAMAQDELQEGQTSRAIRLAEAAVLGEPRNAAYRLVLGNAYLDAGRFASAADAFSDAMTLGDNSPRAALSLALALNGEGRFREAATLLNDREGEIAASDLGLALALSGEPERGIQILSNAIRAGQNTVKMRQNLAYAYAVAGRWRESRLMVAQDVPADQVGQRMAAWAQLTHAEAYRARVAQLLDVPANVRDNGQPAQLALGNDPGLDHMAVNADAAFAAAATMAEAPRDVEGELPAVTNPEPGLDTYGEPREPSPVTFAAAFVGQSSANGALDAVATDSTRFVDSPVVQDVSARRSAQSGQNAVERARAEPAARSSARLASAHSAARTEPARPVRRTTTIGAPVENATHLVQLGSFASQQAAQRAWGIYVGRYPELANREMVITQAIVRGKRYWRVSAGGFDNASARAMCSAVSSREGDGCISWAAANPLPGAVDTGVRLARR